MIDYKVCMLNVELVENRIEGKRDRSVHLRHNFVANHIS